MYELATFLPKRGPNRPHGTPFAGVLWENHPPFGICLRLASIGAAAQNSGSVGYLKPKLYVKVRKFSFDWRP